jgi:hypothetical protein
MPPPSHGVAATSPSSSDLAPLTPTPLPDLNYKQAVTGSQSDVLITLSITRDTTTFTTVIILGGTETSSSGPTTRYQSPTATVAPGSSPTNDVPVAHSSSGTQSQVIIGAVLGSIFGSLLLVALTGWSAIHQLGIDPGSIPGSQGIDPGSI